MVGDLIFFSGVLAFLWGLMLLMYVGSLHYHVKQGNKVIANLLREQILWAQRQHGAESVRRATSKDKALPVARPVPAKPNRKPEPPPVDMPLPASEEWPGWYQDESGEWHQTEEEQA